MKKIVILLALTLGVSLYSIAQFKGGFKGGFNSSDLIVTSALDSLNNAEFKAKAGYNAGCFVNVLFLDNLGMQVDILFSNKGYNKKFEGTTDKINLNYLSWPVMFFYKPVEKLDIEIGPEFGLLMTSNDMLKSFDMGIDIGVRYYISDLLDVGLRYNMGLPFGFKSQKDYLGNIPGNYANSTLQITVGFAIFKEKQSEPDK